MSAYDSIMSFKYIHCDYKKILIYSIFGLLALLGLMLYQDYGLARDEYVNRNNGIVSLNFILDLIQKKMAIAVWREDQQLINNPTVLDQYQDRDYGVAFDLPAIIIERILRLNTSREQYFLRHALTHFIFWISALFFYKSLNNYFKNYKIALTGVVFLYLSPRIFADSFYNNKDLVFLSLFLIATYYLLECIRKTTHCNTAYLAIATGLAIDTRIIGVIIPIIFLMLIIIKFLKNNLSFFQAVISITLYFSISILIILVFWPWLWSSPVEKFLLAFTNMANFRWLNWVFYSGNYHLSTNLPWHYLPRWISITTPPAYMILFGLGCLVISYEKLKNSWKDNLNNKSLIHYTLLVLCFSPILAAILFKSTMYDGWRQFYFVYPAFLFLSLIGFSFILKHLEGYRILYFAVISCLVVNLLIILKWMIISHPYQNIYFNQLAGSRWAESYELDYWGLGNRQALEFILKHSDKPLINVYSIGNTLDARSFDILNEHDKHRLQLTSDLRSADYALTNFRLMNSEYYLEQLKFIASSFPSVFSIKVNNNNILLIYKITSLNE